MRILSINIGFFKYLEKQISIHTKEFYLFNWQTFRIIYIYITNIHKYTQVNSSRFITTLRDGDVSDAVLGEFH